VPGIGQIFLLSPQHALLVVAEPLNPETFNPEFMKYLIPATGRKEKK